MTPTAIAVDWSGAVVGASRRIWLAEAAQPGRLVRLEAGRDRHELARHLLATISATGVLCGVIGLDFAFSLPAWFAATLGVRSAAELWAHAAANGESWLSACEPPFWGRHGHRRPDAPAHYRRTELGAPRTGGIAPKSVFQIGGAGAVGTGSIRGMPLLQQLSQAGATIWPFISQGSPMVVEIYPRILSGPVRKSRPAERQRLLEERYPNLDSAHVRGAVNSEDAFDAAVSALVMIEHIEDLVALSCEDDAELRLEGRIWHPSWRQDRL